MDIDIESLERATLDAVAPAEVGALPGWLLPYDQSTVGRAISAVPLRHDEVHCGLVSTIETIYADRGLMAQFRIADVPGLEPLRQELLSKGYTAQQPTLTLAGLVSQWPIAFPECAAVLSTNPTEAWESVYLSEDFDVVDGANRVRALSRSKCLVYASLSNASGTIAAGTAAFSHGWVSLHGMRTVARERGKGHATALIAALGQEAQTRKMERCFLQVEAGNAPALHLYQGLGFQAVWRYHYWRKTI
ncbi:GNAT family N-acetyltransferase [Rhodoferax lacus]|uniref:GNAT family N-acetyltransferase n=1 Tax=Rhodoferax lacus TaxID=2184758 RepID=A0A3E1RFW0_9BURK|nr:GNAT family N-acetyltransferase [Rhodoferax lacus]RFO98265.1 GNAT family N-acetyltransferase [Rhodoferax lacus]